MDEYLKEALGKGGWTPHGKMMVLKEALEELVLSEYKRGYRRAVMREGSFYYIYCNKCGKPFACISFWPHTDEYTEKEWLEPFIVDSKACYCPWCGTKPVRETDISNKQQ
jgi:hypothetical protein